MSTMNGDGGPRFRHDCRACRFLGRFGECDLYHCPQHGLPTLVARTGSSPAEYISFLADHVRRDGGMFPVGHALPEAYARARAMGLPLGCAA